MFRCFHALDGSIPAAAAAVGPAAAEPPGRVAGAGEPDAVGEANPVENPSSGAEKGNTYPGPTPTGPMVAVYLDEKSVAALQARYPDTREARLRKVVLQYAASEKEHHVYEPLFGGTATVKLTGEGSGEGRRALAATVSFAGEVVEPHSLSAAVDVTPGDQGGGPLGSAVLVEQLKRAGALKELSWTGTLSPMLAHHRHFPREGGVYNRLEEPLALTGSICRADWVDGASIRCRTMVAEGEERRGWSPSGCSLCNTLRSSPCCDIFARWEALSELVTEAEKVSQGTATETTQSDPSSEKQGSSVGEDEEKPAPLAETGGAVDAENSALLEHSEDSADDSPEGERASSEGRSAEEERQKQLMEDMLAATLELRNCIDYHDVFVDAEADAVADES